MLDASIIAGQLIDVRISEGDLFAVYPPSLALPQDTTTKRKAKETPRKDITCREKTKNRGKFEESVSR